MVCRCGHEEHMEDGMCLAYTIKLDDTGYAIDFPC